MTLDTPTLEPLPQPLARARATSADARPSRVPVSLYRLQLGPHFTFDAAREAVSYLHALGVTEAYLSPCLMAGRGSTHGYDISDHSRLNPELGDEASLGRFAEALRARDMGLVLDIVPNHMGIDTERNHWWSDVLQNGPASLAASYFDIDWTPVKRELEGKVLLPILDDQYGRVLERGDLTLRADAGAFTVHYGRHALPIDPGETPAVLRHELEGLRERVGEEDPDLRELLSILTALQHLPPRSSNSSEAKHERRREQNVARQRLAALIDRSEAMAAHVRASVAAWNGTPGDPASFDRLDALLDAQAWRLAYWRTAADEINYRRFFDVNELAGIRMEDPEVFETAHQLLFRMIADGFVTGLRIDHPDGLLDPLAYAERLQARIGALLPGDAQSPTRPFYVTVEKILATGEPLPAHWAVHGTTTYRFLNLVNSVLVDARGARSLRRMFARLTGRRESYADLVYVCKRLIMSSSMASELSVLAHALNDLSESDRRSRDFTLNGLRKALMEVIAGLPAYRTYVSDRGIDDRDRRVVDTAIAEARRRNPALERTIFDFLRSVMLPEAPPPGEPDPIGLERRRTFAMKLQQYTGPVYAKAVEDTAFYRYHVLASLNEVGGDPSQFGRSIDEFHFANVHRLERWPLEMIGTATHDTKRGEDTRARIDAISEMPDGWRRAVSRWMRINASARTDVSGTPAPDRADEYLFYQTLVGVWPAHPEPSAPLSKAPDALVTRLTAYMQKAIKEAKVHTSWVSQDDHYERAVRQFVERTLTGRTAPAFLASFAPFARRAALLGALNSLSQLVLKLTSPGVVDLYQGSELWDLSLVDPDNRQPVDFAARRALLHGLGPLLAAESYETRVAGLTTLLRAWDDGRIKLFILASLLRARRSTPRVWLEGEYLALPGADDLAARHVVAFARRLGRDVMITVAPRLTGGLLPEQATTPALADVWNNAAIILPPESPGAFVNLITRESVDAIDANGHRLLRVADLLRTCPVAVLEGAARP